MRRADIRELASATKTPEESTERYALIKMEKKQKIFLLVLLFTLCF